MELKISTLNVCLGLMNKLVLVKQLKSNLYSYPVPPPLPHLSAQTILYLPPKCYFVHSLCIEISYGEFGDMYEYGVKNRKQ